MWEDEKMWEDVRRCEKMWEDARRCEDEKMRRRWEDEKMWRWEDAKMWRWEDVKMRRCEDEKMWRWEDVKMRRCEDERMCRWEDVKMRGCEDEKMWRWEDVKMRGCEDEKMWRWEDVLQTPTIGRTLRSDALGKNEPKGPKNGTAWRSLFWDRMHSLIKEQKKSTLTVPFLGPSGGTKNETAKSQNPQQSRPLQQTKNYNCVYLSNQHIDLEQRRPAHAKPDFNWLSGPRNGTWKRTCGISCLRFPAPMWRFACSTTQATFTNPSLLRATPLLRPMF